MSPSWCCARVFVIAAIVCAASCSPAPATDTKTQTASAPASVAPPASVRPLNVIADDLPPLPDGLFNAPRPPEVVKAAYEFAARHPEVLKYVPCFCGCERMGHKGNDDCFVAKRGAKGDVMEWESHGMVCEICIDVAVQAMQMHNSGASVSEIRAAVEQKYAALSTSRHTHTPTPAPPRGGASKSGSH